MRKYSDLGADLVIFSGGKGIRGPQSTGLILGRKDLVDACAANSSPHVFIGRPLKVGKEELCGLVAALELYLDEISKGERDLWEKIAGYLVDQLQGVQNIKVWRHFPYRPSRDVPVVVIELEDGSPLTVGAVLDKLREKDPPIYALAPRSGFGYPPGTGFVLNPHTTLPGEEQVVADRLREIFAA